MPGPAAGVLHPSPGGDLDEVFEGAGLGLLAFGLAALKLPLDQLTIDLL